MAALGMDPDLLGKLLGQIEQDPGIPRESPTIAAWQEPSHRLAEVQSETLPECVDFAIIGSGITGCSVAKTLLEHDLSGKKSVTVFEARRLTTGATSRNGGFLMAHAATFFSAFAQAFGTDTAAQIARFCERTLAKIVDVAKAENLYEECQIRDVRALITFEDEDGWTKAEGSFRMYQEHVPEFSGTYTPLKQQQAHEVSDPSRKRHRIRLGWPAPHMTMAQERTDTVEQEYGLRTVHGAFTTETRVFWPYRLVTGIFERLLGRYAERFSIETNTPVSSIAISADVEHRTHPYLLTTPRGIVRAAKVFHCTSGFTGHLLPSLRGPIFPCRLHMACDVPGPQFGRHPVAWLWHVPITFDPESRLVEQGLYWMQQNAETGDLFYGGDKQKLDEFITSDDTSVNVDAGANLKTLLPHRIFDKGWTDPATGATIAAMEPRRIWCGILSMTADQVPIVGEVPTSLSGRAVDGGEWIAAGFNGYGMSQCWSAGEAVARMSLGEQKPEWLPDAFLSTEKRLTGSTMAKEAALQSFFER